jgi:DNA replication and repair protein RecF
LYLRKLHITNFRNYRQASAEFDEGIQCLLGNNGSGKTNLLDAIYYLSFTRTSLNSSDAQNVTTGDQQFVVRGTFVRDTAISDVACSYQGNTRKLVLENGVEYTRLSHHLGKYPAVLIAPGDIELVWDGSEVRRKFFDSLISQIDKEYLEQLITYSALLKMRNSMLRHFAEKGKVDRDLLESNDSRMVPAATFVSSRRRSFVAELAPVIIEKYQAIAGNREEETSISYVSDMNDASLADLLEKNFSRDLVLQRTTTGVHRDDFDFLLNGFELKRYGSQGQQKSFLVGLKLAEFEIIHRKKGFKPILLLDDIFDKLDDVRISRLVAMMNQEMFGQVFLTDARPERTVGLLSAAGIAANSFSVESGNLYPRL